MSQLDLNQIEALASNLRAVSDETYSAAVAVADVYNATSSYDIGDYCIKSTLLYKCNTAIPSGEAWDSSHWDEICVSDELNEIRSSVIHVGTAAPSNPNVQLWLDTDEPGASVVNSVCGKNGTVVLDADDVGAMSQWDLLWTNASPDSSFAAQTVSLDLSEYDVIMIALAQSTSPSGEYIYTEIAFIDGKIHMLMGNFSGTTTRRMATISSTGIIFNVGEIPAGATYNDRMIPLQIWGIKGVKTS